MRSASKFYLYKRSNGFYYVGYFDEGRLRWKSTGATTKALALQAVANLTELFKPKPQRPTLRQFLADFLSFAEGNFAKGTVDFYRFALGGLAEMVGDCLLSSLTMQHLDQYKVMRIPLVSGHTVNRELQALRAAMSTAVRWGMLETNPFSRMEQVKIAETTPRFFNKPELERLLAVMGEHPFRELVLFAVATGMRQGEILNLRWADVDLSRKLIHIQSNPTFRTKAGKRRTIPMSNTVHAMLSSKAARATTQLVFSRNGRMFGESYLTHKFKKFLRLAGLDELLHFHSLRHTHASYLVQSSVPILSVSKLLGHSSVKVTEKHYAALAPETLHEEVNRISLN